MKFILVQKKLLGLLSLCAIRASPLLVDFMSHLGLCCVIPVPE